MSFSELLLRENASKGSIGLSDGYNSITGGSQVSLVLSEGLKDRDELSWSWSYIQDQFQLKKAGELFHKYQARLRHVLFVLALVLNIVHNIAVSITVVIDLSNQNQGADNLMNQEAFPLGLRAASFAVYVILLVLAFKEEWFRAERSRVLVASFLLFFMILNAHSNTLYPRTVSRYIHHIRPTYDIILMIYVMLPFPWKYQCVLAGLIVTALEILFSAFCRPKGDDAPSLELAADATFYIVVGLVGLYIRFLMEIMNGRAFLDRRELIEASFKLKFEKSQEESLLLTVLPQHIASQVRNDIRMAISGMNKRVIFPRRTFYELYIERHDNVSILYADIVNSMKLTASMNGGELVDTLNELFANFDESAKKNSCMRIKLLGDCYNCVSGVPNEDPDHADNCVTMGLEMIMIIRNVRFERHVDVDMRIGVHTGSIMSGIIGSRKWQYDIWSRDVDIASHMEQAGVPGHVHITNATYKRLHGRYIVQPSTSLQSDNFLKNAGLGKTYLISPKKKISDNRYSLFEGTSMSSSNGNYRGSVANAAPVVRAQFRKWHSGGPDMMNTRRLVNRVPLDYSVRQYVMMIDHINRTMDKEISRLSLSEKDQWCQHEVNPLILTFMQPGLERLYLKEADPLFKYYLLCVLVILIGMSVIHLLTKTASSLRYWIMYSFLLVLVLLCIVTTWIGYVWSKYKVKQGNQHFHFEGPWFTKLSHKITKNIVVRIILWFVISAFILSIANLDLVNFRNLVIRTCRKLPLQIYLNDTSSDLDIYNTWYLTFNSALALTTTSIFLKINYLLKFILNFSGLVVYLYLLNDLNLIFNSRICLQFSEWRIYGIRSISGQTYFLIMLFVLLHIIDRQIEYVCRLDFLSNRKLSEEKEEAETMKSINRVLLNNILPAHVAERYLTRSAEEMKDLYCEQYDCVAVMFASIPDYPAFYSEEGYNEQGRQCLQLLNEIICDFDELLFQDKYKKIEKIKTIGSTYMVAAGLVTGRASSDMNDLEEEPQRNTHILVEFATKMMEKLMQMNKDAQQDFHLRMGIAVGPVIAGVVGADKPQYDIWGDTVNTASRMESTGVIGRIQVTKEVASILQTEKLYICQSRGLIYVKGKGKLETFLVETLFDEPIEETTCL